MAVQFRELVEAAPDVIALLDRDGRYQYINAAVEAVVGLAPSEIIGKTNDELMQPTDAAAWRAAVGDVLATGEMRRLDCTLETPRRGTRTFSAHLSRMGDLVCVVSRDITMSHRASDATKFLADASAVLERFDDASFQRIADLAVPALADLCVVHLADPEGLTIAAIAHADPAVREETRVRMARWVPPNTSALARVLAGGPAELAQVDDATMVNAAMDDQHLALMRAAGYRSTVIAPLTGRNRVYGSISFVLAKSGRVYDEADLAMLSELARRTAIALENSRLFTAEQSARRAAEAARDRTRRLQELGIALSRAHDQKRVVEILVDAGRDAVGAAAGFAWMLRNPDTLELAATAEDDRSTTLSNYVTISMTSELPVCEAIRTNRPAVFESYAEMVAAHPSAETPTRYGAWAVIPIVIGDRSVGAASFSFATPRRFHEDERDLLVAMSRQASVSLERCRLLEAERSARADVEASRLRERQLHELAARLSSALTRDEIASILCEDATKAVGAHIAAASIRVDHGIRVVDVVGGRLATSPRDLEFSFEDVSATTDAVRSGEIVWCANQAELIARYPAREATWRAQNLQAGGAIPFTFEERTIGALSLAYQTPRDLTAAERELLRAMGQLTGQALERARLGEAHKQSEERLRDALIAARAATWAVHIDGMRSQRDPNYRRLVGTEAATAPADFSNIHPDDKHIAVRAFERSLADGSPYEPLVRLRRDDGTYRWFQAHGRLTYDDAGKPVTMQGVIVDVEDAHQANLRAEQERRITDTMHRIASTFTSELDHDRLVERIVDELRAAIDAESGAFCIGAESADLPRAPSNLEVPIVGSNGHTFGHLHFRHSLPDRFTDEHMRLVTNVAPQAAVALENARLYSALRERGRELEGAVEHARSADRRKDEFLAMLGHELRNPLAPILTALELIELKQIDGIAKERSVLRRQVDHLARLIDDLLDVSRITRGKVKLEKKTVELSSVLGKAIEMASPLLDKRRQHLEIATMPGGTLIEADPTRLAQVFQNLLTNASKYSDPGSQIAIRATVTDDEVILTVRDNGIGIPAELLPHMFDLFVQGERALDRSEGGLGIGLTVARSLTELHGGRIAVSSEGIGKGSSFTVTLPRSQRPRISTEGMPPMRKVAEGSTARVLLVDDNVDATQMLRDLLLEYGHELAVAHDGPSALELAASFKPNIAVLDIGLPVMSGYDLARKLREQLGAEKLRLIAVTGYGQEADRTRAHEVGFDHHLIKPIALDALLDLLRK